MTLRSAIWVEISWRPFIVHPNSWYPLHTSSETPDACNVCNSENLAIIGSMPPFHSRSLCCEHSPCTNSTPSKAEGSRMRLPSTFGVEFIDNPCLSDDSAILSATCTEHWACKNGRRLAVGFMELCLPDCSGSSWSSWWLWTCNVCHYAGFDRLKSLNPPRRCGKFFPNFHSIFGSKFGPEKNTWHIGAPKVKLVTLYPTFFVCWTHNSVMLSVGKLPKFDPPNPKKLWNWGKKGKKATKDRSHQCNSQVTLKLTSLVKCSHYDPFGSISDLAKATLESLSG